MANAASIIRQALAKLGLIGAGQAVQGDDAGHCLTVLNTMLDAWRVEQLFAYQSTETVAALTSADEFLTIGAGEDFDVTRPGRIELGSFSRIDGIDRPIHPVSRAEYSAISDKATAMGAWPEVCFADAGHPTGRVYFWPRSDAEVHLLTRTLLLRFADLTTDYQLAPGYERAIVTGLAVEVAPDFEVEASASVQAAAINSKRMIQAANVEVPQLDVGQACGFGRAALFGGVA